MPPPFLHKGFEPVTILIFAPQLVSELSPGSPIDPGASKRQESLLASSENIVCRKLPAQARLPRRPPSSETPDRRYSIKKKERDLESVSPIRRTGKPCLCRNDGDLVKADRVGNNLTRTPLIKE